MSRDQGVTAEKLTALADIESEAFDDRERTALRYADAMTDTPVDVSDELFAILSQHFDEKQIVELTSAIAWENYRARFDHALGVESEGLSDGAVCAVS